jgi:hypothetical protein
MHDDRVDALEGTMPEPGDSTAASVSFTQR